jgi:Tfp pilus assembly PilM family ATPase
MSSKKKIKQKRPNLMLKQKNQIKMSKKIKITESQLNMLMERRHTYSPKKEEEEMKDDVKETEEMEPKEEEECNECGEKMEDSSEPMVNEQIEKIRAQFKRFL